MRLFEEKPECHNCHSPNVQQTYKEIPHPNKYNLTGGFVCQCKRCGTSWTMHKEGEKTDANA